MSAPAPRDGHPPPLDSKQFAKVLVDLAPLLVFFGAYLAAGIALLCVALAVTETAQAKMRILRAPAPLSGGCLLALVGLASWLAGGLT